MEDNILGIKGIPSENLSAGVGFIIIPKDIDSNKYKEDVYRTGRVSIYGGYGSSNFYDVIIPKNCLQEIVFPDDSNSKGSPVVWINIPKHNEPIVVSVLKYDEEFYSLSENRFRVTRTSKDSMIDLDLDSDKSKLFLNVSNLDESKNSNLEINISDINGDGTLKVLIEGKFLKRATGDIISLSGGNNALAVSDSSGKVKAKLELSSNKSNKLEYEDEDGNIISCSDSLVNIRADKSSNVSFGDGNEKAVLGDTLVAILEEYDEEFSRMTVNTAFGPSSTRINDSEFVKIKDKFKDVLSKLVNLD